MPGSQFTPQEIQEIVSRYRTGEGVTLLARAFQCARPTIRRALLGAGETLRVVGHPRDYHPTRRMIGKQSIRFQQIDGQRMRAARLAANYSQAALAEIIGVEAEYIRRWEHGEHIPSGPMVVRFLLATQATPGQIATAASPLCSNCQQPASRLVRGLCPKCYAADRRSKLPPRPHNRRRQSCLSCGEHKPLAGRGLCLPCYGRHRYAGTLNQFPKLEDNP